MSDLKTWKLLSAGYSGELVVAVDFPATGRLQADFDDLAPRLTAGHSFWRTVVPPTGLLTGVSTGEYIRPWLTEILENREPVRAVMGFCVGSVYAALLAEEIAKVQPRRPEVILFDPELINTGTIYWQFHMVVQSLSAVLSPEEAEALQAAGHKAFEQIDDPGELARVLVTRFADAVTVTCERTGLGPEFARELVDMFGAFMSYLAIAGQVDALPYWAKATALSSSSADNGLNRVRKSILRREGKFVAEELVFSGVGHVDLLRTDEVAKAATELLTK